MYHVLLHGKSTLHMHVIHRAMLQFWFERAASLPYREWPQTRCSVTINDSGRMPGITDTGYPPEVSD